jgi:hypothetical protein
MSITKGFAVMKTAMEEATTSLSKISRDSAKPAAVSA